VGATMRILITGGCGFIGITAAKALRQQGHDVRLLSSSREGVYKDFPIVRGDVRVPDSLVHAVAGINAVVIGHQFPNFPVERPETHDTFQEVDADGTRHVLDALKAHGQPERVLYLSGAAVQESLTGRHPGIDAKLSAEKSVQTSGIPWTILRPSIVYGPGDHYFSRLAQMVKAGPVVPVLGDGRALSAPIHVDDLAQIIAAALSDPRGANALLDACGPDTLSTNAILDLLMSVLRQRRPIVHLPVGAMNAIAAGFLERLPKPPLTRGLIGFALFDNTSHGLNADAALGLTFRGIDTGVREVYGKYTAL
jgi:nucleoside-diphosphate-sugar epimerase